MSCCPICGRDRQDTFCTYHQTAFNNLKSMHEKWETAAGLTWKEYLDRINNIEDTGRWIQEMIEYITIQGDLGEQIEAPS